jgi:hypothetical protein
MNTKSLVALMICGILVATSLFSAYEVGYGNGVSKADAKYQAGYNAGVLESSHNSQLAQARIGQSYDNGYQAGLQAQNNSSAVNGTSGDFVVNGTG